jgi:polyisoprenoid-binding protein YceI
MSTTTARTLPTTAVWNIDSVHSSVSFAVRHHVVTTFCSTFTNITGFYDGDEGRLSGHVDAADITLSGLDRLKAHILTDDFFNAEEFPSFSFESTRFLGDGEHLVVDGDLTLRGVTRPIKATGSWRGPQTVHHGDGRTSDRLGIDLTATIDRRDFGILFNRESAEGLLNLGWDVKIDAALALFVPVEN